jgi:hypothetical protein
MKLPRPIFGPILKKTYSETVGECRLTISSIATAFLSQKAVTILVFFAIICVQPTFAFKPRTHVWIAQEVLNDVLFDGKVTIKGKEYAVSQRVLEALRENESAYRMGHIGPDAFPDILVGQTVIHPGQKNGWQTDDWLQWSMQEAGNNKRDLAYSLGVLGHAAGDVFAHSYVNMYAGDIFSLTDGETDVELRHIALETFIEKYTPILRDRNGNDLGGIQDNITAPSNFLAKHLILASKPAREYRSASMGLHLVAMREVYNAILKARTATESATLKAGTLIVDLQNKLFEANFKANELVGPIAQARLSLNVANAAFDAHDVAIKNQEKFVQTQQQIIRESEKTINDAGNLAANFTKEISRVQNDIVDVQRKMALTPATVAKEICKTFSKIPLIGKAIEKTVCKVVEVANSAYTNLVNESARLVRTKNNLESQLQQTTLKKGTATATKATATVALASADVELARLNALKQADTAGRAAVDTARDALQKLEEAQRKLFDEALALKNKIDHITLLITNDFNPVTLALKNWEGDVEKAIDAYEEANFAVTKAILLSENPIAPLQEWMNCWAPVFIAVPSEVPGTICVAKHGIQEILSLRSKLREALGDAGWLVDPAGMAQDVLMEELKPSLEDATIQLASLLNGNLGALAKMYIQGADATQLDAIFNRDASNKKLLLIPDVSKRLLADMQVNNGLFNAEKFAPVYNAVVMAKLTLLDGPALNLLANDLGITFPTNYGATLYNTSPTINALLGVLRSIDGSQQWQSHAPSFPRREGEGDGQGRDYHHYGYSQEDDIAKGLRFYAHSKSQSKAFAQLFQGPLSPALETPKALGFSTVLPKWYVAGSVKNPFPRTPASGVLGFFDRIF